MASAFLTGEKLFLRPLAEADLNEKYAGWLNDPEVTRYLETGHFPSTVDDLRSYQQRFRGTTTDVIFGIIDKGTGAHLGNVTLNRINWIHRTADTGLLIGERRFWGKGYAFEAWNLILNYAFHRLGLRKIRAGACAPHAASLSVLERLGFAVEGTLRRQMLVDDEFVDVVLLGLFAEEFSARARSGATRESRSGLRSPRRPKA